MTNNARNNIQTLAALGGLFLGAISLVSVAYAAFQYPFRLEQLETVVVPQIHATQQEIRREIAADRLRAVETRELLLRIEERMEADRVRAAEMRAVLLRIEERMSKAP